MNVQEQIHAAFNPEVSETKNNMLKPRLLNDEHRKAFFTNFDEERLKRIRAIKNQQV